ncbi:hypothetical protein ACWCW7_22560 [Nocardia tengchongensis]
MGWGHGQDGVTAVREFHIDLPTIAYGSSLDPGAAKGGYDELYELPVGQRRDIH